MKAFPAATDTLRPKITYDTPASVKAPTSTDQAPIMTSSTPSPFTSPALLTEYPLYTPVEGANIRNPVVGPVANVGKSRFAVSGLFLPNITAVIPVFVPAQYAPIIMSAIPSPFKSPAALTELPPVVIVNPCVLDNVLRSKAPMQEQLQTNTATVTSTNNFVSHILHFVESNISFRLNDTDH